MEARRLGLAAGDGDRFLKSFFDLVESPLAHGDSSASSVRLPGGTHAIGDLGYSGARNFALVTQNRVKRRL
jgi:hypothetical protein